MNTELSLFIIVEGIADLIFIKDFLYVHFDFLYEGKRLDNETTKIILTNKKKEIHIFNNKGKDFSPNKYQILTQNINRINPNYILFIFDADDNFDNSKNKIKEICKNNKSLEKADIYLFPDNENTGELEEILDTILAKNDISDCWNKFEDCIENKNKIYTIPAKKSKIHTYLEILNENTKTGKDKCKEVNRNYQDPYFWKIDDLEKIYIKKLKEKLTNYLEI